MRKNTNTALFLAGFAVYVMSATAAMTSVAAAIQIQSGAIAKAKATPTPRPRPTPFPDIIREQPRIGQSAWEEADDLLQVRQAAEADVRDGARKVGAL